MRAARTLRNGLRTISALSMVLGCTSLAVLVVLFVAIIALRPFGVTIPSADEFGSIMLAGTFVLGFAAAVARDEHIEVRFVVNVLPPALQRPLALMAIILSVFMVGVLVLGTWNLWFAAVSRGTTMLGSLPIPRAVPIGVVLAGLVLFEVALVLKLLQSLLAGDEPGPGTMVEES